MDGGAGALFVGLISGTSADSIDAVLCSFGPQTRTLAALAQPWAEKLRREILAIMQGQRPLDL